MTSHLSVVGTPLGQRPVSAPAGSSMLTVARDAVRPKSTWTAFERILRAPHSFLADTVRTSAQRDADLMFEDKPVNANLSPRAANLAADARSARHGIHTEVPHARHTVQARREIEETPMVRPDSAVGADGWIASDAPRLIKTHTRQDEPAGVEIEQGAVLPRGRESLASESAQPHQTTASRGWAASNEVHRFGSASANVEPIVPGPAQAADGSRGDGGASAPRQVGRPLAVSGVEALESARAAAPPRPESMALWATSRTPLRTSTLPNERPNSKTAGPSTPHSPTSPEPDRARFDQLIRSIQLQVGIRRSSARLRLDPPELGRIRVDVRVKGDCVEVDVQTETQAARELLSERAGQLKAGLAERGIRMERLDIVVNEPDAVGPEGPTNVPGKAATAADSNAFAMGRWNGANSKFAGGGSPGDGRGRSAHRVSGTQSAASLEAPVDVLV